MDDVAKAFLAAGLPGAVALVALAAAFLVFREWIADRKACDAEKKELLALIVAAHDKRAEDAKQMLTSTGQALAASANAGQAQASALTEVREALRAMGARR